METKFCKYCNNTFTLDHFKRRICSKNKKPYLVCITKTKNDAKQDVIINRERYRRTRKIYLERNKERIAKRQKEYIIKNRDKITKQMREYRKKHHKLHIEERREEKRRAVRELSNYYINQLLIGAKLQPNPELREIQRNIIILKRKKKQIS